MNILEEKLQLHEEITIIYVVDGFNASFAVCDGYHEIASANGKTILEALTKLNEMEEVKNYQRKTYYEQLRELEVKDNANPK